MAHRILGVACLLAFLAVPVAGVVAADAYAATPAYYTVTGNRINYPTGQRYIPYGVSIVDDLDQWNWDEAQVQAASDAQIQGAARYWYVNTIRLQVSENVVVGNSTALHRLKAEVDEIESLGKIPVINDCTIFTGGEKAPTPKTTVFWKAVTTLLGQHNAREYSNVIFDVFNEPMTDGYTWQAEMQTLVSVIRRGPHLQSNLVLIEGPGFRHTLGSLDSYPIRGRNVAFAYHHVDFTSDLARWERDMGLMLKRKVPIIDGEWAQYASGRLECQANAIQYVARYVKLLRAHRIGLIFWSLEPGVGVFTTNPRQPVDTVQDWFPTTAAGYRRPIAFQPKYACTTRLQGGGAGRAIMRYFEKYSSRTNPPVL